VVPFRPSHGAGAAPANTCPVHNNSYGYGVLRWTSCAVDARWVVYAIHGPGLDGSTTACSQNSRSPDWVTRNGRS
jgi:hypothetical protein